jgi:hypothetical protein
MEAFMDMLLMNILIENGLMEHIAIFEQNKLVTQNSLADVTESDYEKMGITALGDRKKLLKLFFKDKHQEQSTPNIQAAPTVIVEQNKTHGVPILVVGIVIILVIAILNSLGNSSSSSTKTSSSSSSTATSSSSIPKYTLMGEMNALGFAISAADYEDAATKISEYSLTNTQKSEANYIKQTASRNKGRLVLGLLSGEIHMMAWTDGNHGSEFYFRPK